MTYPSFTSGVWTEEFRKKVLDAYYVGKLKNQTDIDAMFRNYYVRMLTVRTCWAVKDLLKREYAFREGGQDLVAG